ncbi:MAG: hypothetical protein LBR23_03455 [Spirochaetaceae bacterium]|jgi:hypothetical protein|nr:hypothetical protein [Spirochaetaceae bacterium]
MTAQAKIARFQAGYRVLPPEKQAEIRGMAEAFGAAQAGERPPVGRDKKGAVHGNFEGTTTFCAIAREVNG